MSIKDIAPQKDDWVVDIARSGKPIGNILWGTQEELAEVLLQNIVLNPDPKSFHTSTPCSFLL